MSDLFQRFINRVLVWVVASNKIPATFFFFLKLIVELLLPLNTIHDFVFDFKKKTKKLKSL